MRDLEQAANLVIPTDRVPVAAYQAIYHKLTDKTDEFGKVFRGGYLITKDDLIALHHRIYQAVQQYRIEGQSSQFIAVFEEWESQTISSLEKFQFYNFQSIPSFTRVLSYKFDFLAVLPVEIQAAKDIAQRYVAEVRIQQRYDAAVYALSSIPDDEKGLKDDITLSVEYADFAVGRNIITVLEDWVQTLPNSDLGGAATKRLTKIRSRLNMMPIVFLLFSLVSSAYFDVAGRTGIAPIRYLLMSLAVAVLFTSIGGLLSERMIKLFAALTPRTHIKLTRGDDKLCEREEKGKSRTLGLIYLISITVILALVVNVFASYLATKLFS